MSEQEGGTFKSKVAKLYKIFKGCLIAIVILFIILLMISHFFPSPEKKARDAADEAIEAARLETYKEIYAEKTAKKEQKKQENEQKEQEYKKTYGEELYYAESFYKMFKDKPIVMNNFYKGGPLPMQITGEILDMGTNSYGNYIDLYTDKVNMKDPYTGKVSREKVGDIRVFLADSEWNNKAIEKLKRRNIVNIGGLCYGQTEAFGIKSKVIIGNATILKVNGDLL